MPHTLQIFLVTLTILLSSTIGCANNSRGTAPGLVILVPGVAGDGSWYRNIVPALRDHGDQRTVESFGWGAPGFAFFMNFNNVSIHDSAEKKLAAKIVAYRAKHPTEPLDIIAHSAGGGVTLGALAKLPRDVHIRRIILLHPSVSPTYSLPEPLRVCESITLFHSERDTTFLEWRTTNFGTYDNIKTKAAGNVGFDLTSLNAAEKTRIAMYAHCDADKSLGNNGDHFGALSRTFLRDRVMPLFAIPSTPPPTVGGRAR